MLIDVTDKVVVITGSSRGLGSQMAKAFAKENAKVIINYFQSEEKAKSLYNELAVYGSENMVIRADVTSPKEVSEFYHKVLERYGHVDVLINNAGICDDNLIQLMSVEQWQRVVDVDLTGTFLCCREFSKIMIKQKYGKIINIASLKGQEGSEGQVNYSASKAGIIALTKTVAKELGKYNISVNAICPGFIVTDLNRNNRQKKRIASNRSVLDITYATNDLVSMVVYMSSNMLLGVSGQVFNVDSRL